MITIRKPRQLLLMITAFLSASNLHNVQAAHGQDQKNAVEQKHKISIEWTKMLSHEDWSDEQPSLITCADGGIYAVGRSSRRIEKGRYRFQLWIWKLDARGNREWAKMPEIPGVGDNDRIVWSRIFLLPDERLFLAQESLPKSGTWLIRFNKTGGITSAKRLSFSSHMGRFRGIKKVKGELIGFGSQSSNRGDAWVVKFDMQGNELWQKTYDNGASELACSVSVRPDGSFIMAADSGHYNKFGGGESSIWIVSCDSKGEPLSDARFKGRHASITKLNNGAYMLCFNAAEFPHTKSQIMGIDSKLQQTWNPLTLYEGPGLCMYKMKTGPAGDVIIAGSTFGEIRLWKITPQGKPVWSTTVKKHVSVAVINSLLVNKNEYLFAGSGRDTSVHIPHNPDSHNDLGDIFIAKIREGIE